MNACSKQDLRAIRILLLIFDLNQKNKTMEQAAFTREELMYDGGLFERRM